MGAEKKWRCQVWHPFEPVSVCCATLILPAVWALWFNTTPSSTTIFESGVDELEIWSMNLSYSAKHEIGKDQVIRYLFDS